MITLISKFVLRPKWEKEQFFRPIQPICLLTETVETGNDKMLSILKSESWSDNPIDFTIAGLLYQNLITY